MKKITLLTLSLLALSCGTQKEGASLQEKYTLESKCPNEGDCTVEILKDTQLLGTPSSIGKIYYTTQAITGRTVIKYQYNKKDNPAIQDDSYREEVLIETNNDLTNINSNTTKVVFSVFCFCRDKAGYYEVKDAVVTYKNDKIMIALPEIVNGQLTRDITVNTK